MEKPLNDCQQNLSSLGILYKSTSNPDATLKYIVMTLI